MPLPLLGNSATGFLARRASLSSAILRQHHRPLRALFRLPLRCTATSAWINTYAPELPSQGLPALRAVVFQAILATEGPSGSSR